MFGFLRAARFIWTKAFNLKPWIHTNDSIVVLWCPLCSPLFHVRLIISPICFQSTAECYMWLHPKSIFVELKVPGSLKQCCRLRSQSNAGACGLLDIWIHGTVRATRRPRASWVGSQTRNYSLVGGQTFLSLAQCLSLTKTTTGACLYVLSCPLLSCPFLSSPTLSSPLLTCPPLLLSPLPQSNFPHQSRCSVCAFTLPRKAKQTHPDYMMSYDSVIRPSCTCSAHAAPFATRAWSRGHESGQEVW